MRALKPDVCRGCAHPLVGDDPTPRVHQVHETPVVKPHVVEYRCHRLRCPRCGVTTVAPVTADAVTGYGPRAQAVAAMLTGSCRLGKRAVSRLFDDLFGLPICPVPVSPLIATERDAVRLEPVMNLGEPAARFPGVFAFSQGWDIEEGARPSGTHVPSR
ncbi:hypothetical protein GobsT_14090 [Gemmata obscuriglobus]|nr:hypothetical protein GobsT_14090 [Gemmata obscuriglobus]VTS02281.1 Mobile element protein OS=Hyalangium minutum GN=DB31_7804 PE=4 SV=1: zf-IS66 [Gemmata obscuriglobus UQM 2246]